MLIKATEFRITPYALMFDPQIYIYDFAVKSKLTKFLIVEENHLALAPFIDIRFEPMAKGNFLLHVTGSLHEPDCCIFQPEETRRKMPDLARFS